MEGSTQAVCAAQGLHQLAGRQMDRPVQQLGCQLPAHRGRHLYLEGCQAHERVMRLLRREHGQLPFHLHTASLLQPQREPQA